MNIKQTLITFASALGALLIVTSATYAIGSLTPGDTPGENTQYTTNDIFAKLTNFTSSASEGTGLFTTPGTVSETFNTLSEIYALLEAEEADLVSGKILEGTTIFGVTGTVVEETELEWSAPQGDMNWDTAVSTCAALTEGGATAGDWRLPTISELLAAISDDYIIDGGASPRFAPITGYWSGTEGDGSNAWSAGWSGNVDVNLVDKANPFSVRCVR